MADEEYRRAHEGAGNGVSHPPRSSTQDTPLGPRRLRSSSTSRAHVGSSREAHGFGLAERSTSAVELGRLDNRIGGGRLDVHRFAPVGKADVPLTRVLPARLDA